jgi:hypothetical protein
MPRPAGLNMDDINNEVVRLSQLTPAQLVDVIAGAVKVEAEMTETARRSEPTPETLDLQLRAQVTLAAFASPKLARHAAAVAVEALKRTRPKRRLDGLDQDEVNDEIARLSRMSPQEFADELADMVKEDADIVAAMRAEKATAQDREDHQFVKVTLAAFRSDELAYKAVAAANGILRNVSQQLERMGAEGKSRTEQAANAKRFGLLVSREKQVLELASNGVRARSGILPNQPNPNQRAYERLARMFHKDYVDLRRQEIDKAAETKRLEKEKRKAESKKFKATQKAGL